MEEDKDKWDDTSLNSNDSNEMDIDEIDDELELPPLLSNCDLKQKMKLLLFKRVHTEIEWETELLKQQEILQKKADLERLKQMTKGASYVNQVNEPKRRPKVKISSDDEKSDGHYSSDDDLFNEDEVEAFSSKFITSERNANSSNQSKKDFIPIQRKRIVSNKKRKGNEIGDDEEDDDEDNYGEDKSLDASDDDDSEVDGYENDKRVFGKATESKINYEEKVADDSPIAGYDDCLKLQLRRNQIESTVNEPYFESLVRQSFVRVSLGMKQGVAVYLMAEIKSVKDSFKSYKLDNGKQTSVRLDLAIGNSIKRFRISLISNRRISENEYNEYIGRLKSNNIAPMTVNAVTNRRKELKELTQNHKYTNEEIEVMLDKKGSLNKALDTNNSQTLGNLKKKLAEMLGAKDFDQVDKIQKDIEKLESVISNEKILVEKASMMQVQLNKRNKLNNFKKDVEAAQKMKLQQGDRSKQAQINDPFIRRETRPLNLWQTGAKLESEKQKEYLKLELDRLKSEGFSNSDEAKNIESQLNDLNKSNENAKETSATNVTTNNEIHKILQPGNDEWKYGRISLDEIRERAKSRFGVDPLLLSQENPRVRYLKCVYKNLPPMGSAEREQLRQGITVSEYLEKRFSEN